MQVAEGEFEGVEAIQKAIAEWSIDEQDPAKMYVTFVRTQFEPKQKDAESVQRWKACFKEHNPGMVRLMLPQHLHCKMLGMDTCMVLTKSRQTSLIPRGLSPCPLSAKDRQGLPLLFLLILGAFLYFTSHSEVQPTAGHSTRGG